MTDIFISERELMKTKRKQGVYAKLNVPVKSVQVDMPKLKLIVAGLVEGAFKEYVRKHEGMTPDDEIKFWNQFKPILMRHL